MHSHSKLGPCYIWRQLKGCYWTFLLRSYKGIDFSRGIIEHRMWDTHPQWRVHSFTSLFLYRQGGPGNRHFRIVMKQKQLKLSSKQRFLLWSDCSNNPYATHMSESCVYNYVTVRQDIQIQRSSALTCTLITDKSHEERHTTIDVIYKDAVDQSQIPCCKRVNIYLESTRLIVIRYSKGLCKTVARTWTDKLIRTKMSRALSLRHLHQILVMLSIGTNWHPLINSQMPNITR